MNMVARQKPMHFYQPTKKWFLGFRNIENRSACYGVEETGDGSECIQPSRMLEWEKLEELVTTSAIENVVRKLMASEEGDDIRKRAEKLGAAVRESTEKEGTSQLELNSLTPDLKT
ncbi:hypothetical protein MTR67_017282 [Solanum verrucosum]|uniref:Uncharacterized protein n=1 Tax=Solanum verrucosum TaxID=315347 RepID=A0AAF0QJG1_SOLVR|nr:hypothetical protein MTR67_017282 [Solanum verrucosum]